MGHLCLDSQAQVQASVLWTSLSLGEGGVRCLLPACTWEVGWGQADLPAMWLVFYGGARAPVPTPPLQEGRQASGWSMLFKDIPEIRAMEPGTGTECVSLISGLCALTFLWELYWKPRVRVLVSQVHGCTELPRCA